MATPTEVNINLSGLERRIDAVAASTRRIEENISHTNRKLEDLSGELVEVIVNDLNKLILIFWVTYVILSSGGIAYEHSQVQYKSRNFIGSGEGHYVVDR